MHTAFLQHGEQLSHLLPDADIQCVGSTTIPGSLTKGDLDIQLRIPAAQFQFADRLLAQNFERKQGIGQPGKLSFETTFFTMQFYPYSIELQYIIPVKVMESSILDDCCSESLHQRF